MTSFTNLQIFISEVFRIVSLRFSLSWHIRQRRLAAKPFTNKQKQQKKHSIILFPFPSSLKPTPRYVFPFFIIFIFYIFFFFSPSLMWPSCSSLTFRCFYFTSNTSLILSHSPSYIFPILSFLHPLILLDPLTPPFHLHSPEPFLENSWPSFKLSFRLIHKNGFRLSPSLNNRLFIMASSYYLLTQHSCSRLYILLTLISHHRNFLTPIFHLNFNAFLFYLVFFLMEEYLSGLFGVLSIYL